MHETIANYYKFFKLPFLLGDDLLEQRIQIQNDMRDDMASIKFRHIALPYDENNPKANRLWNIIAPSFIEMEKAEYQRALVDKYSVHFPILSEQWQCLPIESAPSHHYQYRCKCICPLGGNENASILFGRMPDQKRIKVSEAYIENGSLVAVVHLNKKDAIELELIS